MQRCTDRSHLSLCQNDVWKILAVRTRGHPIPGPVHEPQYKEAPNSIGGSQGATTQDTRTHPVRASNSYTSICATARATL